MRSAPKSRGTWFDRDRIHFLQKCISVTVLKSGKPLVL